MDGRAGSDTVGYITGTDTITVDLEVDGDFRGNVLTDFENVTRLAGSRDRRVRRQWIEQAPRRYGSGRDRRGGDDVLRGGFGQDFLDGDEGYAVLNGGPHDGRRGDECVNGEETRNGET